MEGKRNNGVKTDVRRQKKKKKDSKTGCWSTIGASKRTCAASK